MDELQQRSDIQGTLNEAFSTAWNSIDEDNRVWLIPALKIRYLPYRMILVQKVIMSTYSLTHERESVTTTFTRCGSDSGMKLDCLSKAA